MRCEAKPSLETPARDGQWYVQPNVLETPRAYAWARVPGFSDRLSARGSHLAAGPFSTLSEVDPAVEKKVVALVKAAILAFRRAIGGERVELLLDALVAGVRVVVLRLGLVDARRHLERPEEERSAPTVTIRLSRIAVNPM